MISLFYILIATNISVMVFAASGTNGKCTKDTPLKLPAVLVGHSPAIEGLRRLVCEVAKSRLSIVIFGETGTGKTHLARFIHNESERAGSFVSVTCGSLTDSLASGELFGVVKGSYTGATTDRPGLFHAANEGTLFLDELGDLSCETQARIITAVETRRVRRVGATTEDELDVRFLCATNRPVDTPSGGFRFDLLRRLADLRIRMPSLKDRPEDVPDLVNHFLSSDPRSRFEPIGISDSALAYLVAHCDLLKGNVGQLASVVSVAAQIARSRGGIIETNNPALTNEFLSTSELSFVPSRCIKPRVDALCDSISSALLKLPPKELFALPVKNNSNAFVPVLCKLASISDPDDISLLIGRKSELRSRVLSIRNDVLLRLYGDSGDYAAVAAVVGLCTLYVRNLIRAARPQL
ncbi:sigma-54-dependent Fis family transcriptional regulator [Candidatus Micrarchaeota archaeon]|nr:sigma-54-dependent Fis family transcriptional regulator [Candidatus Micrarchaeota archaeon]